MAVVTGRLESIYDYRRCTVQIGYGTVARVCSYVAAVGRCVADPSGRRGNTIRRCSDRSISSVCKYQLTTAVVLRRRYIARNPT